MSETPDRPHTAPPIGSSPDTVYDGNPQSLARTPNAGEHGAPRPLYCVWEITLACDLGCKTCGSRAGKARSVELSTAECLGVVDQLAEVGVREVTLIGGEAYLREDWHEIAAHVAKRGMRCSMTTGARNLTAERVKMAEDAGLRVISISLDGLEHTHDAQRGPKGSWRAAVEASERVAASKVRLTTNTQINRLSMPELPALADLLGEIGSTAWQIQLTVAMGRAADRPDLLLQPYDLLELFPLLVWVKRTKLEPRGVQLMPGNNIGYFGPYEHLLRYGGDIGAHWASCSAGKWSIGLEADGKIKGCPSLPSSAFTGGNLKTDRLADIVANAPELRQIRERTVEDLWGFCRTCYYADVCKAGCSWTSYCLFKSTGNNPYCIHRALQHEAKGQRERVVKVEAAPGVPFDNGRFELVVEPMPVPEREDPTIGGFTLDELMGLQSTDGSAWSDTVRKERLAQS